MTYSSMKWQTANVREQDYSVRFVPVIVFVKARISLAITESKKWARIGNDQISVYDQSRPPVFLLPCLEVDYEQFTSMLADSLSKVGMKSTVADSFPYLEVVMTALKSHSEHWIKLAMQWLEAKFVNDPDLLQVLKNVATTGPTQKLRHTAKHLLKSNGKWDFEGTKH